MESRPAFYDLSLLHQTRSFTSYYRRRQSSFRYEQSSPKMLTRTHPTNEPYHSVLRDLLSVFNNEIANHVATKSPVKEILPDAGEKKERRSVRKLIGNSITWTTKPCRA